MLTLIKIYIVKKMNNGRPTNGTSWYSFMTNTPVLKPSNLLGDGRDAKKGGRREAKVREAGGSDPPTPPPPTNN